MAEHNELGAKGEDLAAEHLLANGYKIIARNWRHDRWEIDIIAMKGPVLSIVEVKTRTGDFFGEPEEGVTPKKERLLAAAADYYIQSHDLDVDVRFDIVSIVFFGRRHELKMIEDAFYPFA